MTTFHINSIRRMKLAAILMCAAIGALPQASAQLKASPGPGALPSGAPRVQLADAIIAVVNNEVITRQELLERSRMVERRMRNQGVALPPPAELQRQLLERMIVDRAQLQLAKEYGIRVDDTMLDRAISRIAEQNKMPLQEFRNQLEREGTPFNRFREEIREEILMQRLREREVDNKIQISESEVENYIAAERDSTQSQQEYNLAQILVRIPENASAEQIAARRQRAEQVMQQIKAGGDFAKLAATYSDSVVSRGRRESQTRRSVSGHKKRKWLPYHQAGRQARRERNEARSGGIVCTADASAPYPDQDQPDRHVRRRAPQAGGTETAAR
jgi:peptidyl-prolyl cis-trans isomerase SurA